MPTSQQGPRARTRATASCSPAATVSAPANGKIDPCGCAASRQLTAVLETAVDAIVTVNEQGVIQTFNRAAERMFGYGRDEVVGRNVSLLMPEPFRSRHDEYMATYLRTGRAKIIGIGREAVGRRNDGTVFPIELAVSEVIDGDRRTFTGLVRDISGRRELEAEILAVSEREQQRIGHELHDGLCQELAGIAFAVQSLQSRRVAGGSIDPAELTDVIRLLQDSVRHARGLAHGLYPVSPQPNGLSVALAQLAANIADVFKVECTFHEDPANPVRLREATAATHLYRIAQAAVRDAIRHGKAVRIEITLAAKPRTIVMTIADDGFALAVDGRYHDQTDLRMMRHRARVLGAKLRVGSDPGGGVRVVCELTNSDGIETESYMRKPASIEARDSQPQTKRRIFLVDDHPIVRNGLAQLVETEPDLTVCGQEADAYQSLSAIRAARPDLLLLDISLQGADGLELLKELKGFDPELPVLMLSMHDESLYAERALRAGANGYIMKQEGPEVLLSAIRKVLGGEIYVSAKMGATLLQRMVGGSKKKSTGELPMDRLSDREMAVFRMIGDGLSVKEIADKLFLSVKTVEAHREHIKEKLNLKSSAELLRFAIRNAPGAS